MKAGLVGTGSVSVWDGRYIGQYISWMNQIWTGRCSGNRALIFQGTQAICRRELKAITKSDKALKGIKLFVSPEYENPFSQKNEGAFSQSSWPVVTGGGRWKKKRGLLRRRDLLRKSLLKAAGSLQKGAGLLESQEQGRKQG